MIIIGAGAPAAGASATSTRARTHDPAAADRWLTRQRLTPGVTSPAAYAAAELRAVNSATAAKKSRARVTPTGAADPRWQPLGPTPLLQTPPDVTQNVSGRVVGIGVSGAGGTAFLATGGGGVWSGAPSGSSTVWTPRTDFQPSLASGAVAVAPSNSNVVYAGTGENDMGGDAFYGQGILASTNGGANWVAQNPGGVLAGGSVSAMAVDPADPRHLYAATSAGFFSSTDGAATLTPPTTVTPAGGNVDTLVADPTNFANVFIGVNGTGIEKSVDGGANFTVLGGGLPAAANWGRSNLAITPDGQTVYAEVQRLPAGTGAAVYKSTNAGTSWTKLVNAPNVTAPIFFYSTTGADQGFYDLGIAVDPARPNTVYIAGIGLSVSTDGGSTWSGQGGTGGCASQCSLGGGVLHPDFHALAFDAAGNLLLGNDGGIYELPAASAATGSAGTNGANFLDLNTNLNTIQFFPGMAQFGNAAILLGGAQDNGTAVYAGAPRWNEVDGGDGGFAAIDPANDQIQYATANKGLDGTDDGWTTKNAGVTTPAVLHANFVPPIALGAPAATLAAQTIYYGGERPYKSVNGGQTWTALSNSYAPPAPTPPDDGLNMSALAVAPSNANDVYAGWGDGTLQVSPDGGASWRTVTPPQVTASTADKWITHIAVDPVDPNHVAVTFSGFSFPQTQISQPNVVETSNALATAPTWTDDTGTGLPGAPTNSVVFSGTALVVATDVGVYSANDAGAATAWAPLGADLPLVQVDDLNLSADGTSLIAATHGRGAWKLTLPATGHELIVDQLRFSGPGGAGDSYVDLYNTSASAVDLTGWSLHYEKPDGSDGAIALPGATTVPAHAHYLVTGGGYSLGAAAAPDLASVLSLPPTGVRVLAPTGAVSDAVGLTTAAAAYRQGAGLSTAEAGSTTQHAFWRAEASGNPVNTGVNQADFLLLATGGPAVLTGAALGTPEPEDAVSPLQRNDLASSSLLDTTVAASSAPNRVYDSTSKTLTIRRTITNRSTPRSLKALRLRISSMSVQGGPGANPHAWLKALDSTTSTVATAAGPVTVLGISLRPPAPASGGGLNTEWTVPLPAGGLPPGQSLSVAFVFHADQGGSFWFGYDALASN